jgi:GNAT superfamily N-acetyltransferase
MIVPVEIRKAGPADASVVTGFNAQLALETEGRLLDPGLLDAGVAAVLADSTRGIYWLAEVNRQVVGQLLITTEWSDWRNGWLWWIQSVFVKPEWRGRGVFQALYHFIEEQAAARPDTCGLRLYVDEENSRAKTAYEHLRHEETHYELFEVDFRHPGQNGHGGSPAPAAVRRSRAR